MAEQFKILIADPEPFIRDALGHKLISRGYKVFSAESGEECIRTAMEEDIDLIIMEIVFKDMDGVKVCQSLTTWDTRDVPIIILTSQPDTPENKFKYNAWAKDFFTKPFSPSAIMKAVENRLMQAGKKRRKPGA